MTCLITECALVDVAAGRWVHGDLFKIGHNYVFNAVIGLDGEADWNHVMLPSPKTRQLHVKGSREENWFFERRGVITFPASFGTFNEAANDYLQGDCL